MKIVSLPRALLTLSALALTLLAAPAAASAQSSKIFVASYGNDANAGTSVSPKRNFQAAHDAVAAGGQIVVLDTAGYGALYVSKSLAITVPTGVNGFVTVGGSNTAIYINATSTGVVSLRGLTIEGGGNTQSGTGVFIYDCGRLDIDGCVIRNFDSGIRANNVTLNESLNVRHTQVLDCANGLNLYPMATLPPTFGLYIGVQGAVSDCQIVGCTSFGVYANGTTTSGGVIMEFVGTTLSRNATGVYSSGQGTAVALTNCLITNNTTGIGTGINSHGGNVLEGNSTDGTFNSTTATQ